MTLFRGLIVLTLAVLYSIACALCAFVLVGGEAHPIEAGFWGAFVSLTLMVVAHVIASGEDS